MVPELVCDEDDPPFQENGGKNTEQVTDAERREERLKVHVFEPGVQRAAQFDHLPGNRSSRKEGLACLVRTCGWGSIIPSRGGPVAETKPKEKMGNRRGPRKLGRRYHCREVPASHSTR